MSFTKMSADLQRIHVKMLAQAPPGFRLDPFLVIFGHWRQDKKHPARWVDLADYAHMARGPGILLAGHQGNFGIDLNRPGLGLLYAGKKDFDGSNDERIVEAFRRCLDLAKALIAEPAYPAELQLRPEAWEFCINDRLRFPNNDETDGELRPAIEAALNKLFGKRGCEMQRDSDPQRRYGFSIRAAAGLTLDILHQRASAT